MTESENVLTVQMYEATRGTGRPVEAGQFRGLCSVIVSHGEGWVEVLYVDGTWWLEVLGQASVRVLPVKEG